MAIKVLIGGIDRTGYLHADSSFTWNLVTGARGMCQIPLLIPPGDTFAPQATEKLEIFDPVDVRAWSGVATAIGVRWIGNAGYHVTTVTGVTKESEIDTAELDKVKYGPGVPETAPTLAGPIVADMLDRAATSVVAGTIADGPEIQAIEVTNMGQALGTLALIAGFVWYVDPADEALYFHLPTARAVAWTLGSADVLWETLDWNQDLSDQRATQVLQLPMVARAPITATYVGDGAQTDFILPVTPDAVLKVSVTPGASSRTVSWPAAGTAVIITPAPALGAAIKIQYVDGGTLTAGAGSGPAARRYTGTRTFTADGGLQEVEAMLATYSQIPSTLGFSVDRPGIGVGRVLTIDIENPVGAGALLNGSWLIKEVNASWLPGTDTLPAPLGFRYNIRAVNAAATALFQGDGEQTDFVLPEGAVIGGVVTPGGLPIGYSISDNHVIFDSPPEGPVVVGYLGLTSPNVPSFLDTWAELTQTTPPSPTALDTVPETDAELAAAGLPPIYIRTMIFRDLTVRNHATNHVLVYHDGQARRIRAVLSREISVDAVIRIYKGFLGSPGPIELIVITIPMATPVDFVLEWSASGSPAPLAQGSPPTPVLFYDGEVMWGEVVSSDGSTYKDGIVTVDVEWEPVP